MIKQKSGVLLDVYESKIQGLNSFWILESNGERNQYFHEMPIKFYIHSSNENLREAWKFLRSKWKSQVMLSKDEKIHPFDGETKPFLAVQTKSHYWNKLIAKSVMSYNPSLKLFDVGHPLLLNYSAFHNLFIFCQIDFLVDEQSKQILSFESKENRWEMDYQIPTLRKLEINSEFNPKVSCKTKPIVLEYENKTIEVDLSKPDQLFLKINDVFREYDPDIILSDYGDNMIFPLLLKELYKTQQKNVFSRDSLMGVKIIKASSIESYGRVIHKKQQSLLFGRHHIDKRNMSFYTDLGLDTIYEIARISGMPLQEVARSTPGRAVASLEIIEALKTGTCIPYKKQKPEMRRNFNEFINADRGGLILQPLQGVYENVISADFDSMFPSIMVFKNLSPETVEKENAPLGVIPRALEPLLNRRLTYKAQSKIKSDKQQLYKSRSDALKWLLVVSFGYTGFKNAPLSSPNIFEQINKWGRVALKDTKNVFEDAGYQVIHAYIDSIFVKSEKRINDESIDQLLYQVEKRTGLPISLECVYKWVVFLPSKMNKKYSVPNSYFGVFEDGEIKTRGIQCRRNDKPPYVKNGQLKILEILSKMDTTSQLDHYLPEVYDFVMNHVRRLKQGQVAIEELIINQRLSKNLDEYKVPSHAAKAGKQLKEKGVDVRAGSKVQFIYVKGTPRVLAWDLVHSTDNYLIDNEHYLYLFEDAVKTVLEPFGIEESFIANLINLEPFKQLSFISKEIGLRRFETPNLKKYQNLNTLNKSFIQL